MADTPKQPYGDVPYADPGYQKDGKKRYPLDTAAHAKAAWSYINQGDNAAQYSAGDLAKVKAKIKAAAKEFGIEISDEQQQENSRPPDGRDTLVRGVFPLALRAVEGQMPTLYGHFAVFNRWTEINSAWEGQFMESISPGAFRNTFINNRKNMRVLFNHGKDPSVGDKVLGPIAELREDDEGAYYEVPLLDTTYNRDLLPGLEAGLYGASFRFSVMKEAMNQKPTRSESNPDGLPERTIQEVRLSEFGPVTFPAYADATAGIRSLTDDFIVRQLVGDPERFQSLIKQYVPSALSRPGAEATHSAAGEPQPTRWPQVSREDFIHGKTGAGRSPFDS
jgi:HK97 family phage prohead protease